MSQVIIIGIVHGLLVLAASISAFLLKKRRHALTEDMVVVHGGLAVIAGLGAVMALAELIIAIRTL